MGQIWLFFALHAKYLKRYETFGKKKFLGCALWLFLTHLNKNLDNRFNQLLAVRRQNGAILRKK